MLRFESRFRKVERNAYAQEEIANAYRIQKLHTAGKDDEIPFKGMALTTVVAEAVRMLMLEHGPEFFEMRLSMIVLGKIAIFGMRASRLRASD